jgi:hypothetical protein
VSATVPTGLDLETLELIGVQLSDALAPIRAAMGS